MKYACQRSALLCNFIALKIELENLSPPTVFEQSPWFRPLKWNKSIFRISKPRKSSKKANQYCKNRFFSKFKTTNSFSMVLRTCSEFSYKSCRRRSIFQFDFQERNLKIACTNLWQAIFQSNIFQFRKKFLIAVSVTPPYQKQLKTRWSWAPASLREVLWTPRGANIHRYATDRYIYNQWRNVVEWRPTAKSKKAPYKNIVTKKRRISFWNPRWADSADPGVTPLLII